MANQPVAEVPDSAPTYPGEQRSSIPLPYTYTMPRKSRDTSVAGTVAPPSTAARSAASQPSLAARKEDSADRRVAEKSLAAATAPSLAANAAARDPAEWVKAIQKLRSEGKNDQVSKELAEFRKLHPAYVLPDDLKNFK